ncbi:hypothetical protein BaRGS_00039842 [Batillaria attramentaria]|uniref:THD domain-containing protein n=1 Tax=Batillaria attramentaria TaxID=370345 RepID=A0ABD0J2L7_9CAEN
MDQLSQTSSDSSLGSAMSGSNTYADIESYPSSAGLLQQYKHTKHKGRKHRSTFAYAAAVTSLVISVVCILAVAGFCGWFFFVAGGDFGPLAAKMLQPNEEVCLPCIQVVPNPFDDSPSADVERLDIRYDSENDTEICCALTAAQYAALFKLILRRQQEVKKLADILGSSDHKQSHDDAGNKKGGVISSSVSAHLLFKPRPLTGTVKGSPDNLMQHWKSPLESPGSHVREGLKLHDNRIYVQTPGLYFIYCQFLYNRPIAGTSDSKEPQVASNYVQRYSVVYPATSDILLKSRHTRYDQEKDRHSSYVGGLFFLHEGDQLFVSVSIPGLVSNDDKASFFGLFRVGD